MTFLLKRRNITELEYESKCKISDENGYQLLVGRRTDSCFVNNNFNIGFMGSTY